MNAQIAKPVHKQVDLNKIKPNNRSNLKIKKSGITFFIRNVKTREKIPNARIIMEKIGGKKRIEFVTDKYGILKKELTLGKYYVYVLKDGYTPYISHPGTFIVNPGFKVANIDLDKER